MANSISTVQQSAQVAKRKPGRPKGSKNRATLLREQYQEVAMEMIGRDLGTVLQDVMDQAKAKRDPKGEILEKGDAQSQKLIWDAFMKGGPLGSDVVDKPKQVFRVEIVSLEEEMGLDIQRNGDDLFLGQGKLSVSIATCSASSMKIHFGINLTTAGTPDEVNTACLRDWIKGLDKKTALQIAEKIFKSYKMELNSIEEDIFKTRVF